jgi:hypothetical protein
MYHCKSRLAVSCRRTRKNDDEYTDGSLSGERQKSTSVAEFVRIPLRKKNSDEFCYGKFFSAARPQQRRFGTSGYFIRAFPRNTGTTPIESTALHSLMSLVVAKANQIPPAACLPHGGFDPWQTSDSAFSGPTLCRQNALCDPGTVIQVPATILQRPAKIPQLRRRTAHLRP